MYVISAYWRWAQKWLLVRKPGFAPVGQFCLGLSAFFYVTGYGFTSEYKFIFERTKNNS